MKNSKLDPTEIGFELLRETYSQIIYKKEIREDYNVSVTVNNDDNLIEISNHYKETRYTLFRGECLNNKELRYLISKVNIEDCEFKNDIIYSL